MLFFSWHFFTVSYILYISALSFAICGTRSYKCRLNNAWNAEGRRQSGDPEAPTHSKPQSVVHIWNKKNIIVLPIWETWGANVQCSATLCYLSVSSMHSKSQYNIWKNVKKRLKLLCRHLVIQEYVIRLHYRKNSKKTKRSPIRKGHRQPKCVTNRVSSSGIHCNFSLWMYYKISLP